MKHYQILYKTADGGQKLTGTITVHDGGDPLAWTTDYVRANKISVHEVPDPNQPQPPSEPQYGRRYLQ